MDRRGRRPGTPRADRPVTGHGTGSGPGRAAPTRVVQSRCDGVLKSPVMNVGIPRTQRRPQPAQCVRGSPAAASPAQLAAPAPASGRPAPLRAVRIRREVDVGEREHAGRARPARARTRRARRAGRSAGSARRRAGGRSSTASRAPPRSARVLPSASCSPTMSARAARIAATTLPKSTTSPPSQMLNVITRTSVVGASWARAGAATASIKTKNSAATRTTRGAYPRRR